MNIKTAQWLAGAASGLLLLPILTGGPAPLATAAAPAPRATSASRPAPIDLHKITPRPFDHRMRAALTGYIATLLKRERVPGASVAVVQNGRVVYQQGFGVRELGKPDLVTPATLMMIGSTGKSMTTTMMMATVVDDRKMRWDTPAVSILPSFAVSDASLTPKITMRHLVCNCTGVQRRDIELFFPTRPRTAEAMIQSLRTFSFAGNFGRTFQYSNQMVATGGYLAALAAGGGSGNLYADYLMQMQRRVFDPIGMVSTTFSFDKVRAYANYAMPHGRKADNSLVPIPVALEEETLSPSAPAGGSWSNVRDLARYLITQLNQGLAPSGTRVVSARNLSATWQPQVQVPPNASYALGWAVTTYKGARLLNHGGGTSGFTSDLTFLPDANLGIAVLTNAQENIIFGQAVRARTLELVYGQPMEADVRLARRAAQTRQTIRDQLAQVQPHLDLAGLAPYQGIYNNPALGQVRLAIKGEKLILDAGAFTTELRSAGKETYLFWDPPLVGLLIKIRRDSAGSPILELISMQPDQPGTYTFTRVQ